MTWQLFIYLPNICNNHATPTWEIPSRDRRNHVADGPARTVTNNGGSVTRGFTLRHDILEKRDLGLGN